MQREKDTGERSVRLLQVKVQILPSSILHSYISKLLFHINSNQGACCMKWTYTSESHVEEFGMGDHNYCRHLFFVQARDEYDHLN